MSELCGSWRVTRYVDGNPADSAWCSRVDGPCPFAGTDQQRGTERRCAEEPGTVLRVKWADRAIHDALLELVRYREGISPGFPRRDGEAVAVAIDALRTCGAEEPVCDGKHEYLRSCPKHGRCLCASEAASPANPSCPVHGANAAPPES